MNSMVKVGWVLAVVGLLMLFVYDPLVAVEPGEVSDSFDSTTMGYPDHVVGDTISIVGEVATIDATNAGPAGTGSIATFHGVSWDVYLLEDTLVEVPSSPWSPMAKYHMDIELVELADMGQVWKEVASEPAWHYDLPFLLLTVVGVILAIKGNRD